MQTSIKEFQTEVASILNKDPWFQDHGVVWLPEDSLDIEYEIKKSLGQTGLVAVVTTPNLTYQGEHGTTVSQNYEKTEDDHTISWWINDEKGRQMRVVNLIPTGFWEVDHGCFGMNYGMQLMPGEERTVTFGTKVYKALLITENGVPKEVSASVEDNGVTDSSHAEFIEASSSVDKAFDVEISLQIVENPTVNRGKPDKTKIATALDVAHHAIYTLAGYDSGNFNNFNPSTTRQTTVGSAGNKLLQVDARFTSTPIL